MRATLQQVKDQTRQLVSEIVNRNSNEERELVGLKPLSQDEQNRIQGWAEQGRSWLIAAARRPFYEK